jgi:hypothetical protein
LGIAIGTESDAAGYGDGPDNESPTGRVDMSSISLPPYLRGSGTDGGANARIGPAAAKIARHHLIDLFVCWLGDVFKKRNGLHDLAGLAIAALRNLMFDPGLQNRVPISITQSFDRDYRFPATSPICD